MQIKKEIDMRIMSARVGTDQGNSRQRRSRRQHQAILSLLGQQRRVNRIFSIIKDNYLTVDVNKLRNR